MIHLQCSGVTYKNIGLRTECRGLRYIQIEKGENDGAGSCRNRTLFAMVSFAAAGNSWWKPTRHDEMVGRQAGVFAQSSALSPYQRNTTLAAQLVFTHRLIVVF
jgi:hypothetical protein